MFQSKEELIQEILDLLIIEKVTQYARLQKAILWKNSSHSLSGS